MARKKKKSGCYGYDFLPFPLLQALLKGSKIEDDGEKLLTTRGMRHLIMKMGFAHTALQRILPFDDVHLLCSQPASQARREEPASKNVSIIQRCLASEASDKQFSRELLPTPKLFFIMKAHFFPFHFVFRIEIPFVAQQRKGDTCKNISQCFCC